MSDNRRIIRGSRFLVTKMFPGGKKYFIEPIKKVIGSILLASETIGTKISDSYWLYYKGLYGDGEYMSFIVDTTLNPDNPNDNTITVPFTLYTPRYSFTIDWGDSTSTDIPANTELLSTMLSHTYDTGGKYTITIISKDKKIPVLNWNNFSNTNKNKNKLVQLSTPLIQFDPSCPNSNSLAYFANGCVNLSSIPKKLFYYNGGVTNYDYCFNGCSKLDHIPSDILKYVKYQSSFQNFISNNPSLIYVPEDLFSTSKALDLSNALSGDFNLKMNIDVNKFFGSGDYINTDVHGIFKDCVNTTGNATDFTTKFTKSVAYVEGTGEFDTGYGTLTGKIYSQVLYNEHGDIVRDLIPAKTGNSYNGKLAPQDCLYDSVEDTFILPTSTFVYGVETTGDYIIENGKLIGVNPDLYLKSSGTQYIDTGYKGTYLSSYFVDFTILDGQKQDFSFIYGNRRITGQSGSFLYIYKQNKITACFSGLQKTDFSILTIGERYRIENNSSYVKINDQIVFNWGTNISKEEQSKIFLFCRSDENNSAVLNIVSKIYSFKIYESDVLIHNFVPVPAGLQIGSFTVPSNGMFDIVEQKFYEKKGTGEFEFGKDDSENQLENNLPNSFKKEALYNCEKWDNFAIPETVWTANPSTRDTWLSTSDRYQDWLVADDKNTLLLNKETFDLTYNSNDSIEATPYHTMSYLLGGRYEVTPDGTIKPDQFSTVDNLINIIKALPDLGSGSQVNVDISHCVNKSELPDEYRQMVQDKGYTLIY